MKNVQAHEIGGLAVQKKKKLEKNNVDYAYYWYKCYKNKYFVDSKWPFHKK